MFIVFCSGILLPYFPSYYQRGNIPGANDKECAEGVVEYRGEFNKEGRKDRRKGVKKEN
jgi:hypothetical protein